MASGVISLARGDKEEPFYVAKGIVDFILQRLGLTDVWYDNFEQTPDQGRTSLWHINKTAEIKSGDIEIGFVGEISPQIISNLKAGQKVAAFSINIDKLLDTVSEDIVYQAAAKFPSVLRDIAVLVPNEVKVVDVMNIMNRVGGVLVSDIDLFDIYQGADQQGRKNLAFHIVFQSNEKTLTGREVDTLQQKIVKALQQNASWEVRK
jgi:phenylalanyl-tRNA synthetase beta chain